MHLPRVCRIALWSVPCRRSIVACLLPFALCCCPAAEVSPATPPPDPPAVQRLPRIRPSEDHTRFIGEGTAQTFVPWGFNYDRDDSGRLLEDYWATEWQTVVEDFREMRALGGNVVRVHLQLGRFMKTAEQPDESNLARLSKLVALAAQTGLYLDVTGLGCYHKQDVPPWYDALEESARWNVQARFWRAVAEVCKTSPAVFCYDLMNEPVASGKPKDDWLPGPPLAGKYYVQRLTRDMRGRTEQQIAGSWIAQLAAAIRSVDSRHMITVGVIPWEQTFKTAKPTFYAPEACGPLDFVSIHLYPKKDQLEQDLAVVRIYEVGKPVVIEEIFPLAATVEATESFMLRSRPQVDGWLSFYWGRTPEEYEQQKGNPNGPLISTWLRRFQAMAPQFAPPVK